MTYDLAYSTPLNNILQFYLSTDSKPKNQRVKRALDCREPKLHENTKTAIFIRGGNTSETVTQALKDLVKLIERDTAEVELYNNM